MQKILGAAAAAIVILTINISAQTETFFQAAAGRWQGTLEYRDYTSNERVTMKTIITIEPSADGRSATVSTIYDDFGKIYRSKSTESIDNTGSKFTDDGTEFSIASIADGRIVLGGATLANGYRNPPDPDPFAEPGWFRTDDVGALDDSGSLRVLGRADDAISTGGLTVLPQPVESALATHPAIADCAVFGVADDRLGQRVVAAVVLRPGAAAPGLDELRTHVEATLPRTAAPRELHIVDEVPRRGIGKIDRQALLTRFGP